VRFGAADRHLAGKTPGWAGTRLVRARASLGLLAALVTVALMVWTTARVIGEGTQTAESSVREIREPRVVVIKSRRVLHLFDGARLARSYPIALGAQPVGQKRIAGDSRTPEGAFRIATRTDTSRYHRFLGLSYPDPAAARRGLQEGLITFGEFRDLIAAHEAGRKPSWSTGLGGGIGLHGNGNIGDWTAGCIALADRDIEELYDVLRIGDVVEILP